MEGVRVEQPNEYHYFGIVEGRVASKLWRTSAIEFSLPIPDEDGFFYIGSTLYMLCNVGLPSPWSPFSYGKYYFLDKKEVMLRVLEHIFGGKKPSFPGAKHETGQRGVFDNFFFQSTMTNTVEVNKEKLQQALLSRLATHPWVRQVADTSRQRDGTKDLVIMFPRQDGLRIEPYVFREDMTYKIDPTSTSASNTINRAYQLCAGAKIVNQQIVAGTSRFCEFNRQNGAALLMTPKRACLNRAAVMNSAELTHPESGVIAPDGTLAETRNLLTAIMDLGEATFEDCIAISESAAARFEAQVPTKISRWTKDPVDVKKMRIKIGDLVPPFGTMAVVDTKAIVLSDIVEEGPLMEGAIVEEDEDTGAKKVSLVASELREEAVLEEISVCPQWQSTERGVRTTWHFKSFLGMRRGDKITCFSGYKGVVIIVPDKDMPCMPDGTVIDVCISPMAAAKRGVVSLFLEMGLGIAKDRGHTDGFGHIMGDTIPSAFSNVAAHYATPIRLMYKGRELQYSTYVGRMAWMRAAKSGIASRRVSAVGVDRPLTGEGLFPDAARAAGQSLDPSKAITLLSRGMLEAAEAIVDNAPGGDIMYDTITAIEGPAREYKLRTKSKDPEQFGNPKSKESKAAAKVA